MVFQQPESPTPVSDPMADLNPSPPALVAEAHDIPFVSKKFILFYTLMSFAANFVILMPTLFSIAYKVQLINPDSKESTLGLVAGVGALVTIITSPLFGQLTDRTRTRWGRRRPWILFGLVACGLAATVIALATTVPVVIGAYVIYVAGSAAIINAVSPVIADTVPDAQRGKIGGLVGVSAQFGGVFGSLGGSLLVGNLTLMFLAPVLVAALIFLAYVFVVPDAPAPANAAKVPMSQVLQNMVFNPIKYPNFALVWFGRFFLFGGINFYSTYQLYFLLDRLGFTPELAGQRLALIGGLGILVASTFAVVGGILSDRLGRRKIFVYLGIVLVAGALLLAAFAQNFASYSLASLMLVAGAGVFGSVDIALASDVVPDKAAAGRWMSIIGVSGYVPAAAAPLVAPLILATGEGSNYLALFIFGAVITLGALITTWRVRGVR